MSEFATPNVTRDHYRGFLKAATFANFYGGGDVATKTAEVRAALADSVAEYAEADAEDVRDMWAEAVKASESVIGITAAAIRDLWGNEHPALVGDEAAIVAHALYGDDTAAREVARETLTAAYIGGPVKRIVAAHSRREDAEDVRQSAVEGLWRGLNAFDPAKHRRPVATIQREVLAALDEVHAARFGMKVPEADRLKFAKANAAHPEDVEAAAEGAHAFGLSAEEFWHIYRVQWLADLVAPGADSLDGGYGEREAAMSPLLPSAATPNVAHSLLVEAMLNHLDGREREVIARRFGLDGHPAHTEDECAAALGLSDRRIRQIQAAALAKLRLTAGVTQGV